MNKRLMMGLLTVVVLLTMGCNMVSTLLDKAVPAGNVAADLWPDVPRMGGMTKTDTSMPLAIRLVMDAMVKGMMASTGDTSGAMEFIAFSTAQMPTDVEGFYTQERMQGAGWNVKEMPGCTGASAAGAGTPSIASANIGTLCLFARKDGDKGALLVIVATQDDKTKKSDLFYTRISGSASKMKLSVTTTP